MSLRATLSLDGDDLAAPAAVVAAMSGPTEIAGTIQFGSIEHHPDANRNIAPSTAADRREPFTLQEKRASYRDILDDVETDDDGELEDDIPYSVLRPAKPAHNLPPLPDLRFEQSYLRSINGADNWWKVGLITMRDQIVMPLVQGLLFNLVMCGWRHWNSNAQLHGNTLGTRLRRWWYGVNNWPIPRARRR